MSVYIYITGDEQIYLGPSKPTKEEYVAADRGSITIVKISYGLTTYYNRGGWSPLEDWDDELRKLWVG